MQTQKQQFPLGPQELPLCEVCHLQPAPESIQHIPFIIAEVILLFYSVKLAIALFFLSYCFAKNVWYCPQCKRQIDINFQVPGSNQNLVLRFGNCMIMLTKIRFRVVATVIVCVLLYFFVTGLQEHHVENHIQKTWHNLANNCGFEAYVQNQFKANSLYSQYPAMGEWSLEGAFLRQTPLLQKHLVKLYIKMSPTQFKNKETEDIVVYQTQHTNSDNSHLNQGDILRFVGQWEGREEDGHLLRFVATNIQNSGNKFDLDKIPLLSSAQKFIRSHLAQKQEKAGLTKH